MEQYEEKYGDMKNKMNQIQSKVKAMEEKYEAGFRSLWNVMSMTESAFFDHMKEHKMRDIARNQQIQETRKESFFRFWK